MEDIELLKEVCSQIDGRSFCGLGDAAAWPVAGALKVFPEEFEYFIQHGHSIVDGPEYRRMAPETLTPVRA
jgi:NADH-quinone oxidoreductase subunit F